MVGTFVGVLGCSCVDATVSCISTADCRGTVSIEDSFSFSIFEDSNWFSFDTSGKLDESSEVIGFSSVVDVCNYNKNNEKYSFQIRFICLLLIQIFLFSHLQMMVFVDQHQCSNYLMWAKQSELSLLYLLQEM